MAKDNTSNERLANTKPRKVYPISEPDKFFNTLQFCLHKAVDEVLFSTSIEEVRYTIILNAIHREEEKEYDLEKGVELIIAGLNTQRSLLEGKVFNQNTSSSWDELAKIHESVLKTEGPNPLMKASLAVYEEFRKGKYDIDDVKVVSLSEYFTANDASLGVIQRAEKNILSSNGFDTSSDCYISVPLIGFIDFDGIAHIIFDSKVKHIFSDDKKGEIITRFSTEYEGLFLDWGAIGEKEKSIENFINGEAFSGDFYKKNPNKILERLNYQRRYKKYKEYYDFRLNESNEIPKKLYTQYLRQAITSILIDSYAHNISAHSLTALSWWFRKRADLQDKEMSPLDLEVAWAKAFEVLAEFSKGLNEIGVQDLRADLESIRNKKIDTSQATAPDTSAILDKLQEEGAPIIHFKGHLSRELAPLFNFLMEKGAYWSGITRDQNIGGKVSSLFSVLWFNFINNPLYLGTTAKTEDIQKIVFRITEYEPERINLDVGFKTQRRIKTQGIFATVDLKKPRTEIIPEDTPEWLKIRSIFVEPGDKFEVLKKVLEKARLYFPGGVVGKHALFTMIENEIRNVKHYHGKALGDMQKDGLILDIGIQPCLLPNSTKQQGDEELYRLSIGILSPTSLVEKEGDHLVSRRWAALNSELTEDVTHSPKLGGTYQDKVCAALLLNSSFSSAQNGFPGSSRDLFEDTKLQEAFFPWVTPSCCEIQEGSELTEYKVTIQNHGELKKEIAEFPREGYSYKSFYMWQGADLYDASEHKDSAAPVNIDSPNHDSWENYSRFRIVTVSGENADELSLKLRREGAVRVIPKQLDLFEEAYRHWLRIWVNANEYALLIQENGKNQALLALTSDGKCRAFAHDVLNISENTETDSTQDTTTSEVVKYIKLAKSNPVDCILDIAHSPDKKTQENTLKYRSHGTYKTYFLDEKGAFTDIVTNHKYRLFELFELLATRICIFDNRIWHRIREDINQHGGDTRKRFYEEKLRLHVHAEGTITQSKWHINWDAALKTVVPVSNFLVLHLSFIEALLNKKYARHAHYSPGNIGLFIEQELKPYILDEHGKIRENFFLVITTGRGNSNWLESLNKDEYRDYFKFTMFRPIETLLSAVDNSISQQDDIELKYRLCKVLFGS